MSGCALMAHWALTARQQGCLNAIRSPPPACGRHALLKPHASSQSLKTSSERSAPAKVAAGAADGVAAARADEFCGESVSSSQWLRDLPKDVQYDIIEFQIGILEQRLSDVRSAAKGIAYLPGDTEERFRARFEEEVFKLWSKVKPWQPLTMLHRDQAFDDLNKDTARVCRNPPYGATVAEQLIAIPEKLSELREALNDLPERNVWTGTLLSVRRHLSGVQHHLNTPRLMQVPRELNYPTAGELLSRTRTVLISLLVLAVLVYSVDEVLRWAQSQVIKLFFEAKLLATSVTVKVWALAASMPVQLKNFFMQALNKSVAA